MKEKRGNGDSSFRSTVKKYVIRSVQAYLVPIIRKELEPLLIHSGLTLMSVKKNSLKNVSIEDYSVKVYSQWGEDGIIDYLVSSIGLNNPGILELGAGDFEECNSKFLFNSIFSRAVVVDARTSLLKNVERLPGPKKVRIKSIQSWITTNNIQEIWLNAQEFLGKIDIVSIDLDGNDYWILSKINDFSSTSIFVVEFNPFFGPYKKVTSIYRENFDRFTEHTSGDCYGTSLPGWIDFFSKRGFRWVGTNEVRTNAFFVRNDLVQRLNCKLPDSKNLEIQTLTPTVDSWSDGILQNMNYGKRISQLKGARIFDLSSHSESQL